MIFSPLQQYILKECYAGNNEEVSRKLFVRFYVKNTRTTKNSQVKIITKSIERLIDREMLVGFGIRTAKKWFIKEVKMTNPGRKEWQKYLNRKQKQLPL